MLGRRPHRKREGEKRAKTIRDEMADVAGQQHSTGGSPQQRMCILRPLRRNGRKWRTQKLDRYNMLHDDLVHPKGKGLDIPGELVAKVLLDDYFLRSTEGKSPKAALQSARSTYKLKVDASRASTAAAIDKTVEEKRFRLVTHGMDENLQGRLKQLLHKRIKNGGAGFLKSEILLKKWRPHRIQRKIKEGEMLIRMSARRAKDFLVRGKGVTVTEGPPGPNGKEFVVNVPLTRTSGSKVKVIARQRGVRILGVNERAREGVLIVNAKSVDALNEDLPTISLAALPSSKGVPRFCLAQGAASPAEKECVIINGESEASMMLAIFGRVDGIASE